MTRQADMGKREAHGSQFRETDTQPGLTGINPSGGIGSIHTPQSGAGA